MSVAVENPVKAAELLVAQHLVEEDDPVTGVFREFVAMSRRVLGESGRGPGHASLVDQKDVVIAPERPVAGHRLMKPAALSVHGVRIPVGGQFCAEQASIGLPLPMSRRVPCVVRQLSEPPADLASVRPPAGG